MSTMASAQAKICVTDAEPSAVNLRREEFHPEWKCSIDLEDQRLEV